MLIGRLHDVSLHYVQSTNQVVAYRGLEFVKLHAELEADMNCWTLRAAVKACKAKFGDSYKPNARAFRALGSGPLEVV